MKYFSMICSSIVFSLILTNVHFSQANAENQCLYSLDLGDEEETKQLVKKLADANGFVEDPASVGPRYYSYPYELAEPCSVHFNVYHDESGLGLAVHFTHRPGVIGKDRGVRRDVEYFFSDARQTSAEDRIKEIFSSHIKNYESFISKAMADLKNGKDKVIVEDKTYDFFVGSVKINSINYVPLMGVHIQCQKAYNRALQTAILAGYEKDDCEELDLGDPLYQDPAFSTCEFNDKGRGAVITHLLSKVKCSK